MPTEHDHYTSPIDGHVHYSATGRAECVMCQLSDERDHLWDVVAAVSDAITTPVGSETVATKVDDLPAMVLKLKEERDEAVKRLDG